MSADGGAGLASLVLLALLAWVLSFSYRDLAPLDPANVVRLAILAVFILCWMYVVRRLAKPTAAQVVARAKRLQAAVPLAGSSGVSEDWYSQAAVFINAVQVLIGAAVAGLALLAFVTAFPGPAFAEIGELLTEGWGDLVDRFEPKTLFIWGILLCFLVPYYVVGLLFLALDLWRPRLLVPFKIQEGFRLSGKDVLRCMGLSLVNQLVMFGVLHLVWIFYDATVGAEAFSKELPSLVTILIDLLCFLPIADAFFYFPHKLLHANAWLFQHIHAIHHSWQAPIALSAIYAHPVEFLVGNLPVVAMGPLLCGSHMVVFYIWTIAAVADTCLSHSGWQLPLLPGNQGHDYHHSQFDPAAGPQNLGVLGCMDALFGTNKAYNASWQATNSKTYSTPDYPVDKLLSEPRIATSTDARAHKGSLPATVTL